MTDQIVIPVAKELEGYLKFMVFDCQNPDIKESGRFPGCDKDEVPTL